MNNNIKYIIVCSVVTCSCIKITFDEQSLFPRRPPFPPSSEVDNEIFVPQGYKYKEVFLETSDHETINGWWFVNKKSKGNLIFIGGNNFHLNNSKMIIDLFSNLDLNIFLFDYRGYGSSTGYPNLSGIVRDSEAAYKFITSIDSLNKLPIFLYAHSVGSYPALKIAQYCNISGIILDSAPTEFNDLKKNIYKQFPLYVKIFFKVKYDSSLYNLNNIITIGKISIPVFIVNGNKDELVNVKMAYHLLNTNSSEIKKIFIIPNGKHNNLYRGYNNVKDEYLIQLKSFINECLSS
jgi:hypothetical protein